MDKKVAERGEFEKKLVLNYRKSCIAKLEAILKGFTTEIRDNHVPNINFFCVAKFISNINDLLVMFYIIGIDKIGCLHYN